MKKEVAIAIVIGLILGLVVTFGIYTARRSGALNEESAGLLASISPGTNPNTSPNSVNNSLVISSPEDGLITIDKEIQVSGTTDPNAFVFLMYQDQFKLEKADATGNFSTKIPTKNGPMIIVVRTIDENGNTAEDERGIFIGNPEEAAATASATPKPTATPRATAKPRTSTGSAQPR
jgi:hypothetical protein